MKKKALIGGVALLVLVAAGGTFLFVSKKKSADPVSTSVFDQAQRGDASGAMRAITDYMRTYGDSARQTPAVLSVATDIVLRSATTSADRVEGIRMAKRWYAAAEGSSYERALAINRIMAELKLTGDPALRAELFKDEPFKSLRVKGKGRMGIDAIARYSISIYPTAGAYLMLARDDAERVKALMLPGSSRPRAATPENAERLGHLADEIMGYVEAAERASQNELASAVGSPYAGLSSAWNSYWKAYALAAAARVDVVHAPAMENAYKETIQTARSAGVSGTMLSSKRIEADAHLSYAHALYVLYGAHRTKDIQGELDAFLAAVDTDPLARSYFDAMFKRLATKAAPKDEEVKVGKRKYRTQFEYTGLASLSPAFKQYLEKNAWVF